MHHHHHHGHPHGPAGKGERRLLLAMLMTGLFMVAEAVGGWLSGSLALLADAGHMLTDTAALAIALFAARAARRPPDGLRSYGYHRSEVLAAFVNGLILLGIVAWIVVEAFSRLRHPPPVAGGLMLIIAVLGLLVNLGAFAVLRGGDRHDLNLRGALLHVLGDLLGSVAAILASAVILATGWYPIDPLLSILVAGLILRSALDLLRQSSHILLEGTPREVDLAALRRDLTASVTQVRDIHHVHVWSLKPGHPLLTMHITVDPESDDRRVLPAVKRRLRERFGIEHSTLQIEYGQCADEAGDGAPCGRHAPPGPGLSRASAPR